MGTRPAGAGERIGQALGWLSIGLGAAQVAAPDAVGRLVGVRPTGATRAVVRAVGVRELVAGAGLVKRTAPAGWLWARLAGDGMDLALLGSALRSAGDRDRTARATAAVGGIAVLDLLAGARASARRANGSGKLLARTSITVNRSPEEVYRAWRDLERLPAFMWHLESVTDTGDGRSHWVAKAPGRTKVAWDAEVVEDRPGEVLAWRSLPGASVPNEGKVTFAPAPGDRGTEVTVDVAYSPPGGAVGAVVAKMFGEEPTQQVKDDLRRFKQVIETGEVLRSDGSPEGTRTQRQLHQEDAQPSGDRDHEETPA